MVYTLGESLLDIIISTPDDVVIRPGGAMLNTAVSLGRSNIDVSLISELGDDNTANLISDFLNKNNVITTHLKKYKTNNTCLALAFLDEHKKPSYTFIKNYPDIRSFEGNPIFNHNDIMLFGSLYSLDTGNRHNILPIVYDAVKNDAIVIYDPNIRNSSHLKDQGIRKAILENFELSSIIKGSDEDFQNIFSNTDLNYQIDEIRKINSKALVIITMGKDGVIADYKNNQITLSAHKTNIKSTVGAGDAFNAGIIYSLVNLKINSLNNIEHSLEEILNTGLRFSAQVCSSLDNYITTTPLQKT